MFRILRDGLKFVFNPDVILWLTGLSRHQLTKLLTCSVSMHERCHIWPRLTEFSDVLLNCCSLSCAFYNSNVFYFHDKSTNKTGRLTHMIVLGNSLLKLSVEVSGWVVGGGVD